MTSLILAVEAGATHLSFAYTEHPGDSSVTVGRMPRQPRPVAPAWHAGPPAYVDLGPAIPELQSLHNTIQANGDTVVQFALVSPDAPERTGLTAASSKFFNKVMRGVTPNLGQTDWGQTQTWVTAAGLPEPTIVGKAAAAAQQIGESVGQNGRVLVIDIGARAATIGMVSRVGGHLELIGAAQEVPVGGGDRVDFHIAWLAIRATSRLSALQTMRDPDALASFFSSVRDAKHAFSTPDTGDKSTVRANVYGEVIEVDVWRHWLDQAVATDTQSVMTAAGPLLAMRPDVVLLIGGGAEFPTVTESLRKALPQQLSIDATTSLAGGALKHMLSVLSTTPPAAEATAPCPPRGAHDGWTLAIDFGTSYTVTAVATAGRTRLIDVDGKGTSKMPSSVVRVDDGTLVVGRHAVNQAVLHPTSFVETPKREIGSGIVLMGGEPVPVVDLVGTVLKRCADEARKQQGGTEPAAVRLTHPAEWAGPRLEVLRDAAQKAGLGEPELIAEPVAAANMLPGSVARAGKPIAIYDFGGGTFDTAVLTPTATGVFKVAGPPGGRDPLGGEDIDDRIIDYLGEGPLGQRPEWTELMTSEEPAWIRHCADLRSCVRNAKEQLAQQHEATIWVGGLQDNHQLTRTQLHELIDADIEATVTELDSTIHAAGLSPPDLAGVYLIGGSSQLSLVTEKIVERFGVTPQHIAADPKTVVAEGAAIWAPQAPPPPGGYRPCRLGARPSALRGVAYRVEHTLSIEADDVSVQSAPSRWSSVEAFIVEQQHADIQQGTQYGTAELGSALGADGAVLFPRSATDGRRYWSSYQLIGDWAICSRWPHDGAGINQIRIIEDRARWSAVLPPLEFADRHGSEPIETITMYTRAGKIPVDVVTRAHSEPVTDEQWQQLFFHRLRQQTHVNHAEGPQPANFSNGAPCQAVKYRYPGKRGWCWYGIVNQRGLSITIEAPLALALPGQMAMALRDAIFFE